MVYPWQTWFWVIAEWLMAQRQPWVIVVAFFTMAYILARVLTQMAVSGAAVVVAAHSDEMR